MNQQRQPWKELSKSGGKILTTKTLKISKDTSVNVWITSKNVASSVRGSIAAKKQKKESRKEKRNPQDWLDSSRKAFHPEGWNKRSKAIADWSRKRKTVSKK
jgi:vancomycin resistance protein YoaR